MSEDFSTEDVVTEVSVPTLLDGVRLDRAVAMVAEISRSAASRLIEAGGVTITGEAIMSIRVPLVVGQTLCVTVPPPERLLADEAVLFNVVHEDADIIVVDKPAGLVVHPGAGRSTGTLVSGLLHRFPEVANVGQADRPGLVHRLDRGTSGLLVVARTASAYEDLVDQLSRHEVTRRYAALVAGHVPDDRGIVDAPIGRSTRTPTKMSLSSSGRVARTAYTVRRRGEVGGDLVTLLDVELETGRTHQIRVHLAAIGHAVVGDERYGKGGAPGRPWLHAAELAFRHPASGDEVRFVAELPADLLAHLPE